MKFGHIRIRNFRNSLAATALVVSAGTTSAAPPDMLMQSANLSGSGNTLNVTRVPVRDSTGKVTYKDIALSFDVSNTGVVTLGPGSPVVTTSPSLNVAGFRAGIYKDSDGRHYQVAGPSVLAGGRTAWTVVWIDPPTTSYSFNANWATGAVTGHPNQTTLNNAGITSSGQYSWGIVGNRDSWELLWTEGAIIGAAQSADALTLHYFGSDTIETSSWVLIRCPAGNLC
ncbi:hypothetical protein [Methylotetracoccus oryzae]|uniref:hypothetical protein n=1 Tax=Methylotetracoccus oryzae TaxID=1919059 RepID=UPI00111A6000|nr:hypothetical protein [Methylotetracoccus oryzae]